MAITIQNHTFHIDTENTSYVMDVYKGYLRHLYFGTKLPNDDLAPFYHNFIIGGMVEAEVNTTDGSTLDVIPQELGTYGVGDYRDSSLFARTQDGVCSLDLRYDSYILHSEKPKFGLPHVRGGETLEIHLKDEYYHVLVKLFFTPVGDAVIRRTEVVNEADKPLDIHKLDSFCIDVPDREYRLVANNGRYGRERDLVVEDISFGVKKFQSTKGNYTSHQTTPFLALCEKNYDENMGRVIGAALIYSGSFQMQVERSIGGDLRLSGGMGDESFCWKLEAKQSLSSPEAILVSAEDGMGELSRRFHDVIRQALIAPQFAYKKRPIVANTWESCFMDFNEAKLKQFISNVQGTGADMVVLDDGWFVGRNDDFTSLGDWEVDTNKLPNGLEGIIDYTKQCGLEFGLWIEPEMISPNSHLYRQHPEWAVQTPNRPGKLGRHQLAMDLCNPEVIEYLKGVFDRLMAQYQLGYIKWDCNRSLTDCYSNALPADRQGEFSHRYILGLYELLEHLKTNYPDLLIEGCAGGGGRFDLGMLYYAPQIWTSDCTCAEERTKIQYGTSLLYPLSAISCHVSDVPNVHTCRMTEFSTRADIASVGVYGYETGFIGVDAQFRENVKTYAQRYNEIADLVLEGDLYRLKNPFEGNYYACMVLAKQKDRGFLVYYRRNTSYSNPHDRLYIYGLDQDAAYTIPQLGITATGKSLREMGLCLKLPYEDRVSMFMDIQKVNEV